ncbi:MAG: hypothetical protein KAI07_00005, partial [Deltaproteobacteria bacterium]|nr:hypothetical protein [Deltaproteobacteria bacterium]
MKQVFLKPTLIINEGISLLNILNQNFAEHINTLELKIKLTIDKNFGLTTMVQRLSGTLVMQQKSNRELDQQLINQVKQGDKTAFKEIYSLFSQVVYNLALRMLRDN